MPQIARVPRRFVREKERRAGPPAVPTPEARRALSARIRKLELERERRREVGGLLEEIDHSASAMASAKKEAEFNCTRMRAMS